MPNQGQLWTKALHIDWHRFGYGRGPRPAPPLRFENGGFRSIRTSFDLTVDVDFKATTVVAIDQLAKYRIGIEPRETHPIDRTGAGN